MYTYYIDSHTLQTHTHTNAPWNHTAEHVNVLTCAYSLFASCGAFHRFLRHLARLRDSDCSPCSQQRRVGGTHYYVWHHLCFHQVWISNQTHPLFSTSIPSSPTPHPCSLPFFHFLTYDPFPLLPVRPPHNLFSCVVFSPFLLLYKVFQIYHLYIMMYGYDNVLYYGKMRKIYFCYWFVS